MGEGGGKGVPRLRARGTDSHASDIGHWLGMTPLRGVRGDAPQGYLLRCVGIAPYERTRGAVVKWTAG